MTTHEEGAHERGVDWAKSQSLQIRSGIQERHPKTHQCWILGIISKAIFIERWGSMAILLELLGKRVGSLGDGFGQASQCGRRLSHGVRGTESFRKVVDQGGKNSEDSCGYIVDLYKQPLTDHAGISFGETSRLPFPVSVQELRSAVTSKDSDLHFVLKPGVLQNPHCPTISLAHQMPQFIGAQA